MLKGLKRVVNSADDISVFGTGETAEEGTGSKRLQRMMLRL